MKSPKPIPESEITDPSVFKHRRAIIKAALAAMVIGQDSIYASAESTIKWPNLGKADTKSNLAITPADLVKNYTNYYEFTIDKEDSSQLAERMVIDPWSLEISGEVEKPITLNLEQILAQQNLQEFVYRHRCVEGWSMVVPWVGFRLVDLLKQSKPLSTAKFVKFTSVSQPEAMPSLRNKLILDWPYLEGLRIDEATHPLAILAVGMYGDVLPKQNGAPIRLVIPWKYGFKSIKAIVKIELSKTPPLTTWNKAAPNEYGFYANVNPSVPHPRWSQVSERQLGSRFFTARRKTELFNGYGEQVAHLYRDMDLVHFY